ncbi:MAG: tRNA (5-methylaminomethyl-2-thiouridine)(34)-methyltransferase MnmD [Bacteroidia bacterium]
MAKPKIITTSDGSHSLFVEHLDEHYHSVHGAVNEALHVFIKNGLEHISQSETKIRIFEMGFGTGLNALVTKQFAQKNNLKIDYSAIDAFPLSWDECQALNYLEQLNVPELAPFFQSIHQVEWNKKIAIDERFSLHKIYAKIEEVILNETYDLIYFDAFGPRAQSDMWTKEIFQKLYNATTNNGTFVTYCAKGQVRRDLESVGYKMERLQGPPGKREMLRGTKLIR